MIRGYFEPALGQPRPFVSTLVDIPAARRHRLEVAFLIDTGADYSVLAPYDAILLGLDWSRLGHGAPSLGVGGTAETSAIPATLTFGDLSIDLQLSILSTPDGTRPLPLPSLLGRDVLSRFCLIVDQATNRMLLLSADERDGLRLP